MMVTIPFQSEQMYRFSNENTMNKNSSVEILKDLIILDTDLMLNFREKVAEKDKRIKELEEENKRYLAVIKKLPPTEDSKPEPSTKVQTRSAATSPIPWAQVKTSSGQRWGHRHQAILRSPQPYDLLVPDFCQPPPPAIDSSSTIEVPCWRKCPKSPLGQTDSPENLEDSVFNARHARLEKEEKDRKRWDRQKIRERLHCERLRNAAAASSHTTNTVEELTSFFPDLHHIRAIEMTEAMPVVVFGRPVPLEEDREFQLPWLQRKSFRSSAL